MTLVLVIFCFSRAGIVQVFCVLSIEIAYIVFLFKSNFRINRYEHYLVLFTQLGYILYAFLSLLTFLPTDQNTKQLYIGFSMAALIIAITYVTLIYVFSIFVYKGVYLPLQQLYYKLYIKNQLANKRDVREANAIVWNDRSMPVKEEAKAVTVKDLLEKENLKTRKTSKDNSSRAFIRNQRLSKIWEETEMMRVQN